MDLAEHAKINIMIIKSYISNVGNATLLPTLHYPYFPSKPGLKRRNMDELSIRWWPTPPSAPDVFQPFTT
jgi:hypothetical protein